MKKRGFDPDKYIDLQSKHILERIKKGNGEKLYLEFGGKLVHDKHAMRVLPGFDENAKIKLSGGSYNMHIRRRYSYQQDAAGFRYNL